MNEEVWTNIATAIQKMTEIAAQLERRHDEIGTRIDRIVAAVESDQPTAARLAELEQENAELKQRLAPLLRRTRCPIRLRVQPHAKRCRRSSPRCSRKTASRRTPASKRPHSTPRS